MGPSRPPLLAVLGAGLALVVLVAVRAPAGGGRPPLPADNAFRTAHIDACVRPRANRGIPGYTLDGATLPFALATGHEPGTGPRCRPGELRILTLEALVIDGHRAYVRRGGCQQPCVVRQPTVHLLARDLSGPVTLQPPAALAGDGAPAAGCTRTVHDAPAQARADLGRMYYKTPAELRRTRRRTGIIGAGARWSNYGDPGRRFRSPGRPAADYNYVLWNLPRRRSGALLPGGGIVRAVIAQGQPLALCRAALLSLPAFDVRGAPDGSVVFAYARTGTAAPIYGWILLGYRSRSGPWRATTAP